MHRAILGSDLAAIVAATVVLAACSAGSNGPIRTSTPLSGSATPNGQDASPTPRGLVISLSRDPQFEYLPVVDQIDRDALAKRNYLYVGGGAWTPAGHYLVRVDHRTGERTEIDSLEELSRSIAPLTPSDGGVAVAAILASGDGYLQSYGGEDLHVDTGTDTMDVTLWYSPYYGCDSGAVTRITYRFTLATGEFRTAENTPVYVPTPRLCTD